MNKASFFSKPVIISLFFSIVATPAFAISKNGIGQSQRPAVVTSGATRSCLAKESSVKIRMTQLTKLVTTMETTFDKIADRVKAYYIDTVLPAGKTVSNYDTLVNDIATKKTLVQIEIDKAKADISGFSCSAGNPVTLMNQFKINMQSVKTALKNYRTSINKLIVAVRTVSAGITPTPTVTTTPSI